MDRKQIFQMKQQGKGTRFLFEKRNLVPFGFVFFLCVFPVLAEELPPLPKGPLRLTSIKPEQLKADYWISRLSDPHKILKTPEEMKALNEDIHAMVQEAKDIFKMELRKTGSLIRNQIELEFKTVRGRILFDDEGNRIPQSLFDEQIGPNLDLDQMPPSLTLRWAAAVRPTSVRALPTSVKMLEEIGDIEFDQLQYTLIKLWTPVGIYHTTRDGAWSYIQAPYIRGWVRSKDLAAFSSREDLRHYVKSNRFLVVLGESIPIYEDPEFLKLDQSPSMGTTIPLKKKSQGGYEVWMPVRGKEGRINLRTAFVDPQSDVSTQFPAFTQANIIRQAFKLLGARYGWGGMYQGRDCSGFTHDVFLSMGLDMPRDSKQQAFVGTQLGHFQPFQNEAEKAAALRSGGAGITLLRMPLHMMLYLGEENGNFYIIHSTWAERISMSSDEKNRINQVIVSDMTLNGNSYLGSLFDRTVSINEIN
ncbi:MAG: SH3 domain-containing protein [Candidatus Omnitrophica bacterium]|nr:SH3 domain-containing protein [Candidatus Omnitrophota bacterium]